MYDGYPLATDAIALVAETVSPTRTYDAGFQVVPNSVTACMWRRSDTTKSPWSPRNTWRNCFRAQSGHLRLD